MKQFERQTPRLLLKVMTIEDLEDFYDIMKLPEVGQWMGTGRGKTREEVLQRIELYQQLFRDYSYGSWGVYSKTDNKLIGQTGLLQITGGEVGIVYALAPQAQGKGYGTECLRATLAYAFAELKRDRVFAYTRLGNDRSRHALEKVGMVYQGIAAFEDLDMHKYVITKEQWYDQEISV